MSDVTPSGSWSPPLTQANGGATIIATAKLLLGIGYSMQAPAGSDDDGHLWMPGEPWPKKLDCSGLVVVTLRRVGLHYISNGNANDQWLQARELGLLVHPSEPLAPGDIGCFLGAENKPGYVGHTGVITEIDNVTSEGLLLSAYTTADGVCETPMDRHQETNESNGLAVVGFYRPANRFPA